MLFASLIYICGDLFNSGYFILEVKLAEVRANVAFKLTVTINTIHEEFLVSS